MLLTVGASGCFGSEPRFLLPAFVLLLPVVVRLSGPSRRWQVVVLVIAATVSWAYGTTWLLGSGPP